MKKLTLIALALSLTFAISGCGKDSPSSSGSGGSGSSNPVIGKWKFNAKAVCVDDTNKIGTEEYNAQLPNDISSRAIEITSKEFIQTDTYAQNNCQATVKSAVDKLETSKVTYTEKEIKCSQTCDNMQCDPQAALNQREAEFLISGGKLYHLQEGDGSRACAKYGIQYVKQ